ncbi:TIR domain-containing protein [Psychroserpens algicola]|uniref:TIR domain-containing protein n=1 Tax=Psychroserpens algicola TaxID=1719034 RepID=A0ABT0H4H9_9FLAO|nr:TIR domain-containing protein [Psychroserpens algicola]MCK8479067.1 TIR domain-containing protein [Psychroserpens algicola]
MFGKRHKVFVSYHHSNDQLYRDQFERLFGNIHDIIVTRSVQIGDINPYLKTETIRQKIRDEYLRDSTVTVVLIGSETWKRKHVDWEIGSSIRHTHLNHRSGLLGIFLPSYPMAFGRYNPKTIPPRLYKNVECGYAKLYNWSTNPYEVQQWIDTAFNDRKIKLPDNSLLSFSNNRSGNQWQ